MAPSAIQTLTTEQREVPVLKLHSTQSGTGDYKQLQPHSFDKDAEEGKLEGFQGAKVRRNARQPAGKYTCPPPPPEPAPSP